MPMEFDDATAANLQAAAKLIQTIGAKPETRRELLGLIKRVQPDLPIPEIDAAKPVEDKIEALAKSVDELKAGLSAKDQNTQLERARDTLRTKHGYTDDGIKELEKFMLETNTADHMVAHDALQARQPPKTPIRPQFDTRRPFEFGDAEEDKLWSENPDRALDVALNKAFEAIQNGMAG